MQKIDLNEIDKAAALLRAGKLVALPTETVYGLGAHARNREAITNIFLAKERPFTHPLIVHLSSPAQLSEWACNIPDEAYLLAESFWPGPLTLILKKHPEVNELVTGGQDTIGLRIPAHPVATALLKAFGDGIAAPSANRFCRLSPTTAEAVREELGTRVNYILDGGTCQVGIESTILDLSSDQPVILRPGMIQTAQLEKVLQKPVSFSRDNAPRVAGMHPVHYAPQTPLVLVQSADIHTFLHTLTLADLPLAFLVRQMPTVQWEGVHWIVMANDSQQYAQDLYLSLRALDKQGFKKMMVEAVPEDPDWEGIRDRLQKAAKSN